MSLRRLDPFAPNPMAQSGTPVGGPRPSGFGPNAIGIGFGAQGQMLCGAALALMLALAAWLWLLAIDGLMPAALLAASLACAAACLIGCARSLAPAARDAAMGRALFTGALACALAAGAALLNGGLHLLIAPTPSAPLLRLGIWTGYWLGCAALLAILPKAWGAARVQSWGAQSLAMMAMLVAFLGGVSLYNPWWGMVPAQVPGLPILNFLLFGYGAPAAMLLVGGSLWRMAGQAWLGASAQRIGACLAALWLILEVRRAFTGPDLTAAAAATTGAWLWGASLLSFSLTLAALWMLRRRERASLRVAGPQLGNKGLRADPNWAPPR